MLTIVPQALSVHLVLKCQDGWPVRPKDSPTPDSPTLGLEACHHILFFPLWVPGLELRSSLPTGLLRPQ